MMYLVPLGNNVTLMYINYIAVSTDRRQRQSNF